MSGRSPRRTTAHTRVRHPASTAAAAAAFVLVAVLPGASSAGMQRSAPAPAADHRSPAALGQLDFGPGTAAPPVPSLGESTDATRTGPPGSRPYASAVALTGGAAAPAALRAVQFALGQLGKPYVWGAEGPLTYDCSGLVQAAYASAGVDVPRVARAQYRATTPVPVGAMIPGDLLFFGPDPTDVESIHHVGIYLGDGMMVHAPTSGDVVRVAPVWWDEFFGATRVLGAVPGSGAAMPFTIPPPAPVFRTVSASRPPATSPVSAAPSSNPASGGPRPGRTGTAPPPAEPAGRQRPTCDAASPGTDRPAAGSAGSVTGLVTGLLGRVLGAAADDAEAPDCVPAPKPGKAPAGGRSGSRS